MKKLNMGVVCIWTLENSELSQKKNLWDIRRYGSR
jgi:hypothetical protein